MAFQSFYHTSQGFIRHPRRVDGGFLLDGYAVPARSWGFPLPDLFKKVPAFFTISFS
jgi:hypothetical protein